MRLVCASFVVAAAFAGVTVSAAITAPSWRPATVTAASASLTTYQEWNIFSDDNLTTPGVQDNAPDVGAVNPNGVATVNSDGTGGEFLTGGGNIYSFSGAPVLNFSVPAYGANVPAGSFTIFSVQVRTLGSELVAFDGGSGVAAYDFSHLLLGGVPISTLAGFGYSESDRATLGGFGGGQVDHLFTFAVPGSLASYTFTLGTRESSTSLDIVAIDSRVVPEPAGIAVAPVVAAALLRRRRRR